MGLKIKWNDDRVRGTLTAILLLSRDRLSRGETHALIEASLAEFRGDPAGYKANKAAWPEVHETRPLTNTRHVAYYQTLLATTERMLAKMEKAKRQFNSLSELDNFLVFTLPAFA